MVSILTAEKRILVEELLSQPVVARLATANLRTGQPHIVPLWFLEEMSLRIYLRYLGEEGVKAADPQSWIHDCENLVVRLTPQKVYTW